MQGKSAAAPAVRVDASSFKEPPCGLLDEAQRIGSAAMQQIGILQFGHDREKSLNPRALGTAKAVYG
jgi:hypothetical protein